MVVFQYHDHQLLCIVIPHAISRPYAQTWVKQGLDQVKKRREAAEQPQENGEGRKDCGVTVQEISTND